MNWDDFAIRVTSHLTVVVASLQDGLNVFCLLVFTTLKFSPLAPNLGWPVWPVKYSRRLHKGIADSALLFCSLCSLILLTLGKTRCRIVKTFKYPFRDAHVRRSWGLLLRTSLPAVWANCLANSSSRPVKPSVVHCLSQHLTKLHEKP